MMCTYAILVVLLLKSLNSTLFYRIPVIIHKRIWLYPNNQVLIVFHTRIRHALVDNNLFRFSLNILNRKLNSEVYWYGNIFIRRVINTCQIIDMKYIMLFINDRNRIKLLMRTAVLNHRGKPG